MILMKTKLKMNLQSIFICTTENQERVRLSKEIFLIKLARTELKCNLILAQETQYYAFLLFQI